MLHTQLIPRRSAARSLAQSGPVRLLLEDMLNRLPARPVLLDACVTHLAHTSPQPVDEALALRAFLRLRQALLEGAPRSTGLQAMWRHAVATGFYAARLATALQLDARVAALAGLLHRAGEIRAMVALARAETACQEQLDAPSRAGVSAEHADNQATRLLAAWSVAVPATIAATNWRAVAPPASPGSEVVVVYIAHLLAMPYSALEFAPPGLENALQEDLGVAAQMLAAVRAEQGRLDRLLQRVA